MVRLILSVLGAAALTLAAASAQAPASLPTPAEAAADPENWRAVDPENLLVFDTTQGRVLIEMFPGVAPNHVEQFRAITRSGDYDGTSFHRVISGFMAQGGDIFALRGRDSGLGDIEGEFTFRRDPAEMPIDGIGRADEATDGYIKGFPIKTQPAWLAESSKDGHVESYMPHCQGIVSAARTNDPNSANSQFFLMRGRAEHLDRSYTSWGRILQGQENVMEIKTGEPPENPDLLETARVAADMPEAERPKAWVQRTDGPAFQTVLDQAAETGNRDVCEHDPVPAVIDG